MRASSLPINHLLRGSLLPSASNDSTNNVCGEAMPGAGQICEMLPARSRKQRNHTRPNDISARRRYRAAYKSYTKSTGFDNSRKVGPRMAGSDNESHREVDSRADWAHEANRIKFASGDQENARSPARIPCAITKRFDQRSASHIHDGIIDPSQDRQTSPAKS